MNYSISLSDRLVVDDNGWAMPITHMFDIDGEDTDDIELVYSVVAGPTANGEWIATKLHSLRHFMSH